MLVVVIVLLLVTSYQHDISNDHTPGLHHNISVFSDPDPGKS